VSLDDPEELGEELLLELGEELLPPLDWSLEEGELELEPVELGELDDPLELGLDELEDEEPDGLLLESAEPDMEPELDPGEVLEPEDEDEPDGEDGLEDDEPLDDLSREAPPELPPRSQP
jgi:hypothetical protein